MEASFERMAELVEQMYQQELAIKQTKQGELDLERAEKVEDASQLAEEINQTEQDKEQTAEEQRQTALKKSSTTTTTTTTDADGKAAKSAGVKQAIGGIITTILNQAYAGLATALVSGASHTYNGKTVESSEAAHKMGAITGGVIASIVPIFGSTLGS